MDAFGTGQGYLKAGFLGFNKSGKTYTAMLLALYLRKLLGLDGPIAMLDTEGGGEYIARRVKAETGKAMIGLKSRAFTDLMGMADECAKGAAPILILDSISLVARELVDSYLAQINKMRANQGTSLKTRMEWQDFNVVKRTWQRWTEFYLNSPLHIIVCGRAGYIWDFQDTENADGTTRKELIKTGVKMKVEADTEFGYEPSLLTEMERIDVPDSRRPGNFVKIHRGTVIGDRFDAMDAAMTENPTGEWFLPHLSLLTPGALNVVDTTLKTDLGVDEAGDADWVRERRHRTIFCEEIEGALVKAYPGQSKEEKRAKVALIEQVFGTTSWTAVQQFSSDRLKEGLEAIRGLLSASADPVPVAAEEGVA